MSEPSLKHSDTFNSILRRARAASRSWKSLVALVVLSIGLLGIASLQLSSLRWNHSARFRSQATLLAYDIVDRMRANQVSATAGRLCRRTRRGDRSRRHRSRLADKPHWKTLLSQTLPSGRRHACRESRGAATTFRITIQWDDRIPP